jgi:hypothetical protein
MARTSIERPHARAALCFGAVSLVALLLVSHSAGASPTINEIVSSLKDRDASIKNVRIKSTWENREGGALTLTESQEFVADDLGRIRLTYSQQRFQSDGTKINDETQPSTFDSLFDGEALVEQTIYERHDRLGALLPEGAPGSTYRTAQIFDSKAHRGLAQTHRNPLSTNATLLAGLSEAQRGGRPLSIIPLEEKGAYSVTYMRKPEFESPVIARNVAEVKERLGYLPVRVEAKDSAGKAIRVIEIDYDRASEQTPWMPRRVIDKIFQANVQQETLLSDATMSTDEVVVNDPQFDESVFNVRLEPDTAVWDSRFNVNYRIGDEAVLSAKVKALSQEAHERVTPGATIKEDTIRHRSWSSIAFVALNVVAVITLFCLWLRKSIWRRSSHGAS